MSEIVGIFQADIAVRTAVVEALRRLRAEPRLVDDVFASLLNDTLTSAEYGAAQVAQARQWFLSTEIPVVMAYRIGDPKFPCLTVSLQESSETEATLGDVHFVPEEPTTSDWPVLAGPFTPTSYSPSSGLMGLPSSVTDVLTPGTGMVIFDAAGGSFPVVEVLDDSTVSLQAGMVADFRGALVKSSIPRQSSSVEGVGARETYAIGCHVQGESTFLTYLHSLVYYSLLKYKQELLEARGLERTTVTSSDFRRNDLFGNELVFSRAVIVNGYVRQTWRKDTADVAEAVDVAVTAEEVGSDDTAVIGATP